MKTRKTKRLIASGWCAAALIPALLTIASSCTDDAMMNRQGATGNRICFNVATDNKGWNTPTDTQPQSRAAAVTPTVTRVFTLQGKDPADRLYLHMTVNDWDEPAAASSAATQPDGSSFPSGTRAAPVTTEKFHESFGVFAHVYKGTWDGTQSPNYMNNVEVSKDGDVWSPEKNYYWPGKDWNIRFLAYAPYEADPGITVPDEEGKGSIGFDIDYGKDKKFRLKYTVPNDIANQQDLMVATCGEQKGDRNQYLPMKFQHILTGVRFIADGSMLPGRITEIRINNVENMNYYTINPANAGDDNKKNGKWERANGTVSYSLKPAYPANDQTKLDETFMLIPEEGGFRVGAAIVVTYKDTLTSVEHTLSFDLSDSDLKWPMGQIVTYRISSSSISATPTLDITLPDTVFSYKGGSGDFTVTSCATVSSNEGSETVPVPWTAEFYDEDKGEWTNIKPEWLANFTLSGDGSTTAQTYNVSVSAQADSVKEKEYYDDKLKVAPVTGGDDGFYDLSTCGGTTLMNTANCYVINAPGKYKLPLVYGNLVKNGQTNFYAAVSTENDIGWNSPVLKRFVNHVATTSDDHGDIFEDANDVGSGSPYIYEFRGFKDDPAFLADACLVWQDEQNLVTEVALSDDKHYLTFKVDESNIRQGNAVVALRDKDGYIMWSWHIWATPYKLGEDLVTVTNKSSVSYDFLPLNIGWCYTRTASYAPRSVKVRIKQDETGLGKGAGKEQIFTIKQSPHTIIAGNNPYFQYGRKEPMPAGMPDGADKYYTANPDYEFVKKDLGDGNRDLDQQIRTPYGFNIRNGDRILSNLWNSCSVETSINDDPVTKTIYDPSPVGYSLPPMAAFTGFTYEGQDVSGNNAFQTRFNSPYTAATDITDNNGWEFFCKPMKGEGGYDRTGGTIFFPLSGYRHNNTGDLTWDKAGYWSATPYDTRRQQRALEIYTDSKVGLNADKNMRDYAYPVRPVRE